MLELAVIHRPGILNGKLNLGRILETMLYYDRVHLMMSAQMFVGIWDELGPDDARVLMGHHTITTTLTPEMLAVHTNTGPLLVTHRPIAIKMAGTQEKLLSDKDVVGTLHHMLKGLPNRPGGSWAEVNRLVKLTKTSRYAKILGDEQANFDRFLSLAQDSETVRMFICSWAMTNGLKINYDALNHSEFSAINLGDDLLMTSTVPPARIISNWSYTDSWGGILSNMQDYAVDLHLSNNYAADIVSDPGVSEVASTRVDLSLQRSRRSRDQVSAFEEMVFDEAHGFADAFNGGLITFAEAIKAIDQSRRFRGWAKGLAPDADLIAEYHRAVTKDTILKSLPASVARFAIFNGAGAMADLFAPGSSMIASAIDAFVVERVIGGWRPNIFVNNLKKVLDSAERQAGGG